MGFLDDYEPVEDRLREFWADHPTGRIATELVAHGDGDYIVRASVWRELQGPTQVLKLSGRPTAEQMELVARAWQEGVAAGRTPVVSDGVEVQQMSQPPDATGLAHDSRAELPANMKASALEVCETSAIGRALANLGYAAKGKRPSREEMAKVSASTTADLPSTAQRSTRTNEPGEAATSDGGEGIVEDKDGSVVTPSGEANPPPMSDIPRVYAGSSDDAWITEGHEKALIKVFRTEARALKAAHTLYPDIKTLADLRVAQFKRLVESIEAGALT